MVATLFLGFPVWRVYLVYELEYYDKERGEFVRLTPDARPMEETAFNLEEDTRIRAYAGVYLGAEGDYLARLVIHREDY